jgi:hypothetical protein
MRKGSSRDYTAEIDCSQQSVQKSQLGEPHECYSLYRNDGGQTKRTLLGREHRDSRKTVYSKLGEDCRSTVRVAADEDNQDIAKIPVIT